MIFWSKIVIFYTIYPKNVHASLRSPLVSTHEQVSVCVRFVECIGGKFILCEEFLGSVSASETIGENLAELF